MTREEFIEDVRSWNDLLQFCYDENCYCCEDVYDEGAKDDYFNNDIVDMARSANDWRDLYRRLEDIPTGCDYYIRNDDYDEWRGADDDDFDNYKSDVLSWGDDREVWDEDDEEDEWEEDALEEEYEVDEASEEDEALEEGCSLGELFTSSAAKLQTIEIEAEREREQAEQFFEQFISAAV